MILGVRLTVKKQTKKISPVFKYSTRPKMALHQKDATYAPHNIVPNFLFSIVIARRQKIMK